MGLADADAGALDRVGRQRRSSKAAQVRDELGQRERPLDVRPRLDHRCHHVLPLEAEHEVERLELDAGEVARGVARKIEAELLGDRDRFGQGGLAAEVECPERDDPQRQAVRLLREQRRGERAAEAVPGADEGDSQLAQEPIRFSILTCRARTSGPASHGAKRMTRAFQRSAGSLGASRAASR